VRLAVIPVTIFDFICARGAVTRVCFATGTFQEINSLSPELGLRCYSLSSGRPVLSEALARYSFFLFDQSVTAVTDLSFASSLIPTTATSIWRQEVDHGTDTEIAHICLRDCSCDGGDHPNDHDVGGPTES
jgi:hypothetical protein